METNSSNLSSAYSKFHFKSIDKGQTIIDPILSHDNTAVKTMKKLLIIMENKPLHYPLLH